MTFRHWSVLVAGVLGLGIWWWSGREVPPTETLRTQPEIEKLPLTVTATDTAPAGFVVTGPDPISGRVGEGLNAIDGSAQRDLVILQEVLAAWRSNSAGEGNPVGDNQEITATLTGRNRWGFAIIPPDHPAINAAGELCDRWGTPLFFHQISGERMEIISLGPDRLKGTDDDLRVSP